MDSSGPEAILRGSAAPTEHKTKTQTCVVTKCQSLHGGLSPGWTLNMLVPVIKSRPRSVPYLRTDEGGKEKEKEVNGHSDKRRPALRQQEEKH